MLVDFFLKLRDAAIPVSITEYLALLDALDHDVCGHGVEDFYHLSRSALVKDERHFDRFDIVFGAHFKGVESLFEGVAGEIPVEWLRKLAEKNLSEEEKTLVASIVSVSFTVVTTLGRSVPALEHLARRYGYGDLCRKVRASEIPVLALEDPASGAREQLRAEVRRALDEDGCEAIVLGCAGMVDMARSLSEELGVPVVEGVTAAVKIVEGLAALGIATSKRGGYAPPRPKAYTGAFARFAPGSGAG